jgi:hypothetical protein
MATFKSGFRVGKDSNLCESFSALTKADVKDGSIAGVASPYSADHKQAVSMALINADDKAREISSGISKLYRKVEYGTKIDSVKYLEDFNRFSTLLLQALKINDVLSGDEIILKKLADILSYAYVKKNKGDFKIYSSFEDAKAVTLLVYKTVKKIGLNFLTPDIDDVVQKVLFSVLYKPKKDGFDKKPESKKDTDKLPPKPQEGDSNGKPIINNASK